MVSERVRQRREIVAALCRDGQTVPQIAKAAGVTNALVSSDLATLGLKAAREPIRAMRLPGGRGTNVDLDKRRRELMAPLAAKGMTTHEIAAEVEMTPDRAMRVMRQLGIDAAEHPRFRGTTPRVAARHVVVARMVDNGMTTKQISQALELSIVTILKDQKTLGIQAPWEPVMKRNSFATSGELTAGALLAVKVTRLLLAGLGAAEVAVRLRVPLGEVEGVMAAFDVPGALAEIGLG